MASDIKRDRDTSGLSDFRRYWPNGKATLWNLEPNLVLAIPPQYQRFWFQKNNVQREPTPIEDLHPAENITFQFFLPDFSGYTPDNYQIDFDKDRVDVVEIQRADPSQTQPGSPGSYPPNMFKRLTDAGLDPKHYEELYGLRCYRSIPPLGNEMKTCYGQRDRLRSEDIILYVHVAPFSPATRFPNMQAEYFTQRFGGLRIVWRTHVKNLPRWHDIDSQIWKFLDVWNISQKK